MSFYIAINWAQSKKTKWNKKKPFELIEYAHIIKWLLTVTLIEKTIHAECFPVRFAHNISYYIPSLGHTREFYFKYYQWHIAIFQSFSGNSILVICKCWPSSSRSRRAQQHNNFSNWVGFCHCQGNYEPFNRLITVLVVIFLTNLHYIEIRLNGRASKRANGSITMTMHVLYVCF